MQIFHAKKSIAKIDKNSKKNIKIIRKYVGISV